MMGPGVELRFRRPPARMVWHGMVVRNLCGCNRCVDAGPPYRVVKTAGLNLPAFHYLHNKHQAGLMQRDGWVTTTFRLLS